MAMKTEKRKLKKMRMSAVLREMQRLKGYTMRQKRSMAMKKMVKTDTYMGRAKDEYNNLHIK